MNAPLPELKARPPVATETVAAPRRLRTTLAHEGFRLFFPLAALHAAFWPFLWVVVQGRGLWGVSDMPPVVWHMHEMLWGSFGAALIGFLTTGIPEWTDTPVLRGRVLWWLAAAWGAARLIGLIGLDLLTPLAALADLLWIGGLLFYAAHTSWQKHTREIRAFVGWLTVLFVVEALSRWRMMTGDAIGAIDAVKLGGLIFLALLGLALARISVPVTNLILDPSETTSPFRPHPGRINLAPGLVAIAVAGLALGVGPAVGGWLLVAAGAGFIDRMSEGFIGRAAFRVEIMAISLPAGLAGAGLIWVGAARIGDMAEGGGWHLMLMGGLGLAVLASMSVAGLFHAGLTFPFPARARAGMLCLAPALFCRIAPEFGIGDPMLFHPVATIFWALTFGLWLSAYWPILADPATIERPDIC